MDRTKKWFKRKIHSRSQSSLLQPTPSPTTASATALQSPSAQGLVSTPRPVSAAGKLQTPPHNSSLLGNSTAHTPPLAPPPPTAPLIAGQGQSVVGHGILPLPGSVPSITVNGPPGPPQTAQQGGSNTNSVNKAVASNNPPITPLAITQVPSLWKQAFDRLSECDAKMFISTDSNKEGFSQELLDAITAQRDICQQNRWKFRFRGKEIIVRDLADKLLDWVDKFKNIGNVVASYDPSHAALPWAGVRFVLQIALTDREAMGVIMVGIERIAGLLVRGSVHEELYLRSKVAITGLKTLEESFVELYYSMLQFLACAKQQLERSTTTRMLRTILDMEGGESLFKAIEEREKLLEVELTTADREIQMHGYSVAEDHHNEIMVFLRGLEDPISRIDLGLASMYSEIQGFNQRQERLRILQWICDARYIEHHNQAKESLLDRTGQWLINRLEFRDWQNSSASGILWLRGMPGAGKTKLTCMVIDHLASPRRTYEPVVYFYCNRNEPQRRMPEVVMRAIVKQLCVVLPDDDRLPQVVLQEYKAREQGGLAAGDLSLLECERLIVSLLDIHPQTTIIIDALDEVYQEKRWTLISSLQKIIVQSPSLVKIFVSSRDYLDISLTLEGVPNMYIEATDNGGDIARYVRREVQSAIDNRRLLAGRVSGDLKARIISTIESQANGMFQWADLQIKQLYQLRFEHQIIKKLGKLPKTLEQTYLEIWHEICQETEMQELTKRALMWVMCSMEPLSKSLWAQLSYRNTRVEPHDLEHLFDLCRNLVVWDKQLNKPIFSHLSVQEFLEENIFTEREAHGMAAYTCISYLSTNESHKSWSGVYEENTQSSEDEERNIYVRSFWPDHVDGSFNEANPIDPNLLRLLNHFLSPNSDYATRAYPRLDDRCSYRHANERLWGSLRWRLLMGVRDPLFVMSFFQFGEEMECLWKEMILGVNIRGPLGASLLAAVCTRRSRWILDFLLEKGVEFDFAPESKLDRYESYPQTCLFTAIRYLQAEAIIKLLEKGAAPPAGALPVSQMLPTGGVNILENIVAASGNDLGCLKRVLSWNRLIFLQNEQITRCMDLDDKLNDNEQRHPLKISGYFRMARGVLFTALRVENAREILGLLFSYYPRLKINMGFLICAVGISPMSAQAIQYLLDRNASLKVTEPVLISAAESKSQGVIQLLLNRDEGLEVTEAVLVAAAANEEVGSKIIQLLINRDASLEVTEAVLVAAAANEEVGSEILQFLINRDASLEVTEAMLVAAAANWQHGSEVIHFLINRDPSLGVTEAVLVAAAASEEVGSKIIQFLINRDASLEVTKAVLVAAAANWEHGSEVIQFLINRDAGLEVSEAVLLAAAANKHQGSVIIQFLINRYAGLEVTEAVLVAAAANIGVGSEIIQFLINRDAGLKVTEAVLVAAAANLWEGSEVIQFLINRDAGLEVTEAVLVAAAANFRIGSEITQFLINRDAGLEVTEAVLVAVAANGDIKGILEFTSNRQPRPNPTQSILLVELSKYYPSPDILDFLFDRDPDLKITEPVMRAAASSKLSTDILMCFFRRDPTLKVTEPTLLAIASNEDGDDTMEFLFNYGAVLEVSKAIILAAAETWSGYHGLPMFMLLQHCKDLAFTEHELKRLRSTEYKETIEEVLGNGEEDGCSPRYSLDI